MGLSWNLHIRGGECLLSGFTPETESQKWPPGPSPVSVTHNQPGWMRQTSFTTIPYYTGSSTEFSALLVQWDRKRFHHVLGCSWFNKANRKQSSGLCEIYVNRCQVEAEPAQQVDMSSGAQLQGDNTEAEARSPQAQCSFSRFCTCHPGGLRRCLSWVILKTALTNMLIKDLGTQLTAEEDGADPGHRGSEVWIGLASIGNPWERLSMQLARALA